MKTLMLASLLFAVPAAAQRPADNDLDRVLQFTFDSVYKIAAAGHPEIRNSEVVADRSEFTRRVRQHVNPEAYQGSGAPNLPAVGAYDYKALAACQLALKGGTCRQDGTAYFHITAVRSPQPEVLYVSGMFEVPLGKPVSGGRYTHKKSLFLYFTGQFIKRDGQWHYEFLKTSRGHM